MGLASGHKEVERKQYCRYCSHAFDYNGEGTEFLCSANAPCGNNGSGRFYQASKAKRPNKCRHFDFCNADIFRQDENGNFAEYKPRKVTSNPYKQMKLEV